MLSDDNAKIFISANVNAAMDLAGMSQTELARRTEESDARISLVRRGVHIPSSALLARIAEALRVSTDWLLADPAKHQKPRRRSLKPVMPNAPADVHRPKKGERPVPKQTA